MAQYFPSNLIGRKLTRVGTQKFTRDIKIYWLFYSSRNYIPWSRVHSTVKLDGRGPRTVLKIKKKKHILHGSHKMVFKLAFKFFVEMASIKRGVFPAILLITTSFLFLTFLDALAIVKVIFTTNADHVISHKLPFRSAIF